MAGTNFTSMSEANGSILLPFGLSNNPQAF